MVRGDARSNPEGDIQSSPVDSRVLERILKAVCEERLLKPWMNEDGRAYKNTLATTTMERDGTYLVPKPPSRGRSPPLLPVVVFAFCTEGTLLPLWDANYQLQRLLLGHSSDEQRRASPARVT